MEIQVKSQVEGLAGDKRVHGDAQSAVPSAAATFPPNPEGADCLAAEVGDALGRLRALLKHRSSAADIAIRAEALVLEAELRNLQDGASSHCQEELLREALFLCPSNFMALIRLATIFHEQGKSSEVARLLAQAERLSGPQGAAEIRRHLASGSGADIFSS